ncbi:MAG: hypothetical protein AB2697_22500, partial [Candidatus Thiodiazotropha endolucinida]
VNNIQELIESNPTSHPQNQMGKKHTHKWINDHGKPNELLVVNENSSNIYSTYFLFQVTKQNKLEVEMTSATQVTMLLEAIYTQT